MQKFGLDDLMAEIAVLQPGCRVGRVCATARGIVSVSGLSDAAAVGDLVRLGTGAAATVGEVVMLQGDTVSILADSSCDGLQIGDPVLLDGACQLSPHDAWIGRTIDPLGNPIDGSPMLRGPEARPVRASPPLPAERRPMGGRLETGLAAFNTLLPVARGQRVGLFAGSGVGKTSLLARLCMGVQADLVVVAMIGERGREIREFTDRVLGPAGMARSIVVAATADQSPIARRRCAWTAMTVAEHFRDQGQHVLLVADSITRFAEAHREIALACGEPASLRGFPPSTAHEITALCERAGPGTGFSGDITALLTVLVAGSDMEEPVADIMRGVLDGHIVLDRQIAERGRFPAVDLLRSVSRALPDIASPAENRLIVRARQLASLYEQNELMVRAGLYTAGTDPDIDAAVTVWPRLDEFLAAPEHGGIPASFARLSSILAAAEPPTVNNDVAAQGSATRAPDN